MKTTRSQFSRFVALGAFLGICGMVTKSTEAQPTWWTDTGRALLEASQQTGKSMVLYFESPGSADCQQMDSETWPSLPADGAAKYLWKKCTSGKKEDEAFFAKYEINSVPEIIVLDSARNERGRLRGFIAADLILSIIDGLPTFDEGSVDTIYTYGDGLTFKADEIRAMGGGFDPYAHAYLLREDFDSVGSVADLDRSVFDLYLNPVQTIRIAPGEGYFSSNGLYITGFDMGKASMQLQPSVAARLDLGERFKKVNLVQGIIEIKLRVRVTQLPDDRLSEVIALTITPATAKAPQIQDVLGSLRASSQILSRMNSQSTWNELTIRTREAVNFKQKSAWLSFWVDGPQMGFMVDDIRIRLLSENQADQPAVEAQTADPNKIFESKDESVTRMFKKYDVNGDLKIVPAEIPARKREYIQKLDKKTFQQWWAERDKDGNGWFDPTEFREN